MSSELEFPIQMTFCFMERAIHTFSQLTVTVKQKCSENVNRNGSFTKSDEEPFLFTLAIGGVNNFV